MGVFGGSGGGGGSFPPMNPPEIKQPEVAPLPAAPPPVPDKVPLPTDPDVVLERTLAKKRAAMSGYAATLSGNRRGGQLGDVTTANTTAGPKTFLGQ